MEVADHRKVKLVLQERHVGLVGSSDDEQDQTTKTTNTGMGETEEAVTCAIPPR